MWQLTTASAPIPFRGAFGHAAATRRVAENILVRVQDTTGHVGLGEGCPRAYVTGETVASAEDFLARHRAALARLPDLAALRGWLAQHSDDIDRNPSACCAAELALLDLFARRAGQPLEAFLGVATQPLPRVSAVYGTGSGLKFHGQRLLFGAKGLRDAKLKLSGEARQDAARAGWLARRGPLRLDANNLWPTAAAAGAALRPLAHLAWAVEEPMQARDWPTMVEIAATTGLAIIADESFLTASDLAALPAGKRFLPNFRVSKLGGLLRSLDLLALARRQGRRTIVGAQVGETSILARAGLVLAAAAGPGLAGYEGAYGTRLLRYDLVSPSIGFGRGGQMESTGWQRAAGSGLTTTAQLDALLH